VFGHDFEGKVSRDLAPLVVALARSGLPPASPAVWPKAFVDAETGHSYDVNTDQQTRLSAPIVERDQSGKIVRATYASTAEATRHAETLRRKGKAREVRVVTKSTEFNAPTFRTFTLPLGPKIRRLAVKMATALIAFRDSAIDPLSVPVRRFLLGSPFVGAAARLSFVAYDPLDALRPALAHVVFVEAEGATCYGVVQLFGSIQFYLPLSESYSGPSLALLLVFDPLHSCETLTEPSPLHLPPSPEEITEETYERGIAWMRERLNAQIEEALGKDVGSFSMTPHRTKP